MEFVYTLAPPTDDTPVHSRPDVDTANIKEIIRNVLIIDYIINLKSNILSFIIVM